MNILDYAKTILVNEKGEVLLLKRSNTDAKRPGEWDLAGGQIEPGEEIIAGATREIREEAGINIDTKNFKLIFAGTTIYPDNDTSVNRLLFLAHVTEVEVQLSPEHDEYRWVDVETALAEFPHPFYSIGLKFAHDNHLL